MNNLAARNRPKRAARPEPEASFGNKNTFYEFFCGSGMARIGLGDGWECLFANDIDVKKADSYQKYFGYDGRLIVSDIANITTNQLPGRANLAWASFPCQDLSLAGNGAGLAGKRSGTFKLFWDIIIALRTEGRKPRTIVLENVYGAVTSHAGRDLSVILESINNAGYRFGPLIIDAELFLPQSRPRLFIVAVDEAIPIPSTMATLGPVQEWHPDSFDLAYEKLSESARSNWIWWNLPIPQKRVKVFSDLIEESPHGVSWHTPLETARLLEMMSPVNRAKLEQAKSAGIRCVGGLYRRTRVEDGIKRQRAEVRFDHVAGCLRTPTGGSSRQTILIVEGQKVRSRLIAPREAARLMGLPEDYPLPPRYNDAYHLVGDGVAVPVVRHLSENLIEPLLAADSSQAAA